MDILVIDDDCVDRERIKRELISKDDKNIHITEATTAAEGIDMYAMNEYDVVLLDYRLPDKNGIETLRALKEMPNSKGTAIIIASTINDIDIALACIRSGAQDFIPKNDITPARLVRAIVQAQERFTLENKLQQSYEQAKVLAERDTLTGLANRHYFDQSLQLAVKSNRRGEDQFALLLLDLDHFKDVNDTFGHDVGDKLLLEVTRLISHGLRENDLFARVGGDEFGILINSSNGIDHVSSIAQRIIESLNQPLKIADIELNTNVSIGIAVHPQAGGSGEELFKHADIAMYYAKENGRGQYRYYDPRMKQEHDNRVNMEADLTQAINNEEFKLEFQPQFDLASLELVGFEALIRWSPNGVLMNTLEFIQVAEASHQIIDIGRWVIENALQTLAHWSVGSNKQLSMAINLSAVQLGDSELVSFLDQNLHKYSLDPEMIEFELTETSLIHDPESKAEVLRQISEIGCKLALDDFGTGFSSLSHLSQFPINTLKIDKSLIQENYSEKDFAILQGITDISRRMKLLTVAEGVESESQMKLCQDFGIDRVQGFLLARPMTVRAIDNDFTLDVHGDSGHVSPTINGLWMN